MTLNPMLIPTMLVIASAILVFRTKSIASIFMLIGFLLVLLMTLLSSVFPDMVAVSYPDGRPTQDVWENMKTIGLISSIGSMVSAIAFIIFALGAKQNTKS